MSVQVVRKPGFRLPLRPWTIPVVVVGIIFVAILVLQPNFSLLADTSPAIRIHLATAVTAFVLGVVMLTSRKGVTFHRIAGWLWVGIMLVVAVSSLFITGLNGDSWSWIHILSGLTLVQAPLGLVFARRHNVKAHRQTMTWLFIGAMVVAGGFTFLPGRLMWQMFFG